MELHRKEKKTDLLKKLGAWRSWEGEKRRVEEVRGADKKYMTQ